MSNYKLTRDEYAGAQSTEIAITRVGGASDGVQSQSTKIVTNAQATFLTPYREMSLAIWNDVTGTDVTVTVYGVAHGPLPTNTEVFLECQYLGDASSPLASFKSTAPHPLAVAANVPSDSSVWSSQFTVFDALSNLVGVTLSNGNRTATHNTTASTCGARCGLDLRANGKYYFEMTPTVLGINGTMWGIMSSNAAYQNSGFSETSVNPGGTVFSNNTNTGKSVGTVVAGDIIGCAVDMDARKGWLRRNGGLWNGEAIGISDPAAGLGGVTIQGPSTYAFSPAVNYSGAGSPGGEITILNTGQQAYGSAPPSGFGNWDPVFTPFKLTATLTSPQPQQRGYIYVRIFAANPLTIYYIDPKVALASTGGVTNGPVSVKITRDEYAGSQVTETSIVRVGGATTGDTAISSKVTANAQATFLTPYRALPLAIWNDVTGADVTVTVCGTIADSSLPLNDEIWMECQYLGDASYPLAKFKSSGKSHPLAIGVAVAADGSTWGYSAYAVFESWFGPYVTLLNNDLTATLTIAVNGVGARSLSFQTTGKFYFEVTITQFNSGDDFGITPSTTTFTNVLNSVSSLIIARLNGTIYTNGSSSAKSLGTLAPGDVVGCAFDLTGRKGWFRKNGGTWNNDGTADPATGIGSVAIPATIAMAPVVAFGGGGPVLGDSVTANFGQTAYSMSVPLGFSNWPPNTAVWTRFKLVATLTSPQPQQRGYVTARVMAAKPNTLYYLDPKIILS